MPRSRARRITCGATNPLAPVTSSSVAAVMHALYSPTVAAATVGGLGQPGEGTDSRSRVDVTMVSDVHEPMSSGLPFISLLRRRGWIVVLTAIVAVVVALLWLLGHRSEYGATAKLRFHTKHQRHLVAAAQTAGPTPGWLALDHALQATRRHIPSGVEPAPTQQLDVVAISATKSSPELAAKSANRFAAGLVRSEKRRHPGSHAVSVVRSAAPPTSPLSSDTGRALGIAGALGALLGLAFAFLVERFGPPVPANTTKVTDRIRPARVRRRRLRKRPAWGELPRQGPP